MHQQVKSSLLEASNGPARGNIVCRVGSQPILGDGMSDLLKLKKRHAYGRHTQEISRT